MHVRVVRVQISSPRVEHTEKPDSVAAEILGILQQRANRLAARIEDRAVACFGMSAQQRPQLLGNCKRDDEVLHRKEFTRNNGLDAEASEASF